MWKLVAAGVTAVFVTALTPCHAQAPSANSGERISAADWGTYTAPIAMAACPSTSRPPPSLVELIGRGPCLGGQRAGGSPVATQFLVWEPWASLPRVFYWRKWMATFGMSRNGTCSHTRGGGRFDVKCQGCTHLKPQLTLLIKPPLNLHDLNSWPAQHERERFRCWTEPEPCRWPPNGSARAAARGVGQSASNLSQAT
jgi:hypothetical protein